MFFMGGGAVVAVAVAVVGLRRYDSRLTLTCCDLHEHGLN